LAETISRGDLEPNELALLRQSADQGKLFRLSALDSNSDEQTGSDVFGARHTPKATPRFTT